MGIEYSVTAAYGFGVEAERPKVFKDMEPYEGHESTWLHTQGWNLLEYDEGGNSWSGENLWYVYVTGTKVDVYEKHGESGITYIPDPDSRAIDQLIQARAMLAPGATLGYFSVANIY